MNYIFEPISKKSRCNLFADYLIQKLGVCTNSIFYVTDHKNFYVINGVTESKDIINLNEISEEFNKRYKNFFSPITHTIDLIDYSVKIEPKERFTSYLFLPSDNISFHPQLIQKYKETVGSYYHDGHRVLEYHQSDTPVYSSFPHGFSLKQGRLFNYYAKHVGYNISRMLIGVNFSIELIDSHVDPIGYVNLDGTLDDESLKSYLLDSFDFNYEKFINKIQSEDLSNEVLDPLNDFNFLKENVKLDVFI